VLKPLSRETLTYKAAGAIWRFIIQESLSNGDRLPSERELTEALAVSRNIIREALEILEDRGIIVRQVGKGTFVQDHQSALLVEDLFQRSERDDVLPYKLREARWAIEVGALEFVVQRITEEELEELTHILEYFEQRLLQDGKNAAQQDIDFHLMLLRATKNEAIVNLSGVVVESYREDLFGRLVALQSIPEDKEVIADHWAIVQALRKHDLIAAQEAMRQHFYHFVPGNAPD